MKKKAFSYILCAATIFCSFSVPIYAKEKNKVTINVYNWGEYISNGANGSLNVNEEFTKRTGIEVNYTTFQSNEELYAKLASGGANYDVIIPSDYMVSKLIDNNMLQRLNFSNIPNFSKIDNSFINPIYDKTNQYSVPYTWGTVGIFYNKKEVLVPEDEIGWDILWNKKYAGKILMFDNSRDSFGISLIRLGKSVNTTNADDWKLAADELIKQKPLVQAYVMDQIFDKMGNNEAVLAPYYSGDAALLTNSNKNIGFVIPKEGTTKFVDAMCVPTCAEHKKEAEMYINFMCNTDIALANIEYIGYSTPQKEVRNLLDPSISENKNFYPDEEHLKNAQIFTALDDETSSLIDELWIFVKTGGKDSTIGLILVLLLFLAIYIGILVYKRIKLKRELLQLNK